jgi:hypothetical protein
LSEARLRTIAFGYMGAYRRLHDAYSQAFALRPEEGVPEAQTETVFVALFEALNWLDALRLRPEAERLMDADLRDALRFVRGRVHHQFDDAIELRRDVPLPVGITSPGVRTIEPILMTDWCWREAIALRGGARASTSQTQRRSGETAYRKVLAGRQVRQALDQVVSIASQLVASPSSSLGCNRAGAPSLGLAPAIDAVEAMRCAQRQGAWLV